MSLKETSYDNALIAVRQEIIAFTSIQKRLVVNATSVRGPDVMKMLTDTVSASPDLSDTFIVFEMTEDQNLDYGSEQENDDYQAVIMPYKFGMKIYGTLCHEYAKKILAGFKSPKIAASMYESGVWIRGVSRPESINEIINNTVWPRCDMSISFETRLNVACSDKIYVEGSIDSFNVIEKK